MTLAAAVQWHTPLRMKPHYTAQSGSMLHRLAGYATTQNISPQRGRNFGSHHA